MTKQDSDVPIIFIRCNGSIISYDYSDFCRGLLHCASDAMVEKCEGCGDNICSRGELVDDRVRCGTCERTYPLRAGN